MGLSREVIEREIAGSKAAIKSHKEGLAVNQLVLEKFEEELNKYPKKKKEAGKNSIVS